MNSNHEDLSAVDLSKLADLLQLCRTAFLEISATNRWEPAAGSLAATDRHQLVGADPQPSAAHRMAGHDLIREQIASFLEIASLQLNSISALLPTDLPLLAVESLGRAALEAMAHAITLLHPQDGPRERLAKAYVLEAQSAHFAEKIAPLRPANENISRRGDLASVLDRARIIFAEVDPAKVKKDQIGDIYSFPGYTKLSANFINLLRLHGGLAMDPNLVGPTYSYLSSSTHPALFRVEDLRIYDQDGSTALRHMPGQMVGGVRLVVALYVITLWSVCDYFGWDKTPTDAIWDLLDELFPGTVTG